MHSLLHQQPQRKTTRRKMFLLKSLRPSIAFATIQRNSQFLNITIRNATKKAGGTVKNGRDSPGQRLGIKKLGSEFVKCGNILVRQRGSTVHAGKNVSRGSDFTLYSMIEGRVFFDYDHTGRKYISVYPYEEWEKRENLKLEKRKAKKELRERKVAKQIETFNKLQAI